VGFQRQELSQNRALELLLHGEEDGFGWSGLTELWVVGLKKACSALKGAWPTVLSNNAEMLLSVLAAPH
jgi:hypothetical protein